MITSNFNFLEEEFPLLFNLGQSAEYNLHPDPVTCLMKLRQFAEQLTILIYEAVGLEFPDMNTFHLQVKKLTAEGVLPSNISDFIATIRKKGNEAVHDVDGTFDEAKAVLFSSFKLGKWFYEAYSVKNRDLSTLKFHLPGNTDSRLALAKLEQEHAALQGKLDALLKEREVGNISPQRQKEIATRTAKATSRMEMSEAETRELIDEQLRQAGWEVDTPNLNFKLKRTIPKKGKNMAIAEWKCGSLWADYALFIDEQLVGLIEAKKHIKNVMADLGQAMKYSKEVLPLDGINMVTHNNCEIYRVPFMFSTNGRPYLEQMKELSGIWFWDARHKKNRQKPLVAWFSPRNLSDKLVFDELEGAKKLEQTGYELLSDPKGLNLREYQIEAIKAVEDHIINHPEQPRALLAMATGTGKTRTMIGMCYRLIDAKRFKRILFLVDRRMLGSQASDAFKEVKIEGLQTFAQIYDLKDLESAVTDLDTKIHFATVQSMVKRISLSDNPPGIGDYDCIVVDEAHRGYILDREMEEEEMVLRDQLDFQSKYRMVLDYFDAYRIGLTATPAIHTAEIFGDPIYTYSYRRAVVEGYLVDFEPPKVFKTRLSEGGIVWEAGDPIHIYDPEENAIVEAGITPDEIKVEIQGFNKRVINESFNRTVLRELIENHGIDPEDRKKTLIFAATDRHADEIIRIMYEEYENLGETVDAEAILKITGVVYDRDMLLKRFKNEQYPSIVVTVDLLTTGIDVPSISNLVFLRRVNSRILYDQMIGRATRRCDEIDKEVFKIYDCVGVTEIMAKEDVMKPVAPLVEKSFAQLSEEAAIIKDEYMQQLKLDRIIAKLQRKLHSLDDEQKAHVYELAGKDDIQDLIHHLKGLTEVSALNSEMETLKPLWDYLDAQNASKGKGRSLLFSAHQDELSDVYHAYNKNLKPKDYIESFNQYIKSNINEIAALKVICTKPGNLTRKELKSLQFLLDEKGYTGTRLNTAYKDLTQQEIVADIIAHVRTAALGSELVSHYDRIGKAMDKIRSTHQWSSIQLKWLKNIEDQLLKETIITIEDLEKPPFSNEGGIKRLDRVFKGETSSILAEINGYLYA
ncbi:type I restriction-modification system endonuclease [Pedobacter sp. N36a]|uniref:type I restriction-modification system endonuclease n=1 Tax=Pedobacter sp. N36a TaxID=2767996 RepID=UPI0016572258|nr:type I restriction-modification system endonuclease [Pedobacter sp. N36a]MBC8986660.1 type I restriction-modification system endonuclease [Pedobacter sp. N36a]